MTTIGTAPSPVNPYAGLPELPEFTLTSTDIQGGHRPWSDALRTSACFGQDRSLQLSWSDSLRAPNLRAAPPMAVPCGFWH